MAKKKTQLKKPDHFYGSITDLIESSPAGQTSEIELMRIGKWDHPYYGEFEITLAILHQMSDNFHAEVRKIPLPIDREHRTDEGAVGWIRDVYVADDQNSLIGKVEWTDEGFSDIKAKKYRYFSPEYADEYEDPASGVEYKNVLLGGGITNRPFFQELKEITLSDRSKGYQFTNSSQGGEKTMTKEELKAKLQEDPDFKPAEEDKVTPELLAEVQKEIADEAADGDEGEEGSEGDEGKDGEEGSEGAEGAEGGEGGSKKHSLKGKTIKMSENEVRSLREQAAQGAKAFKQMREMKMTEKIKSFSYSAANVKGSLLPVSVKPAEALMFSLSEHQVKLFTEFLKSLPSVEKVFNEAGKATASEETATNKFSLHDRATKLMSENPEKYKEGGYKAAAVDAEKLMKDEGIDAKEIQYS